ncbi:N-acetylmuramoyl-L-alanine amidase [Romboutsia weinsteinii]|nr:N-acetylmuramoyl-L-alanine amidase [Romboutsia weinsteinii]
MKICINPGHTLRGVGSGAVGIKNESEENRKVASEIIRLLKESGYEVIESRVDSANSNEEYLNKCVKIANGAKADLFVSIHFNSYNKSASGVEALVYEKNNEASKLAGRICESISELGFKNRGVKIRPELYVIRKTTMSAILIECCFIDSSSDMNMYEYRSMARAIVKGITGKSLEADNVSNEKLYRVCVGSYKEKDNANKRLEDVKNKGYKDSFIYIDI